MFKITARHRQSSSANSSSTWSIFFSFHPPCRSAARSFLLYTVCWSYMMKTQDDCFFFFFFFLLYFYMLHSAPLFLFFFSFLFFSFLFFSFLFFFLTPLTTGWYDILMGVLFFVLPFLLLSSSFECWMGTVLVGLPERILFSL